MLLGLPAVIAAGLFPVLTPDENEGPTGPYPLPIDINGVGRAVHTMDSTPQTTALAVCGFLALIPVIGAALGLMSGLSAAKARANAADMPRVAVRAPKLPCLEQPAQTCPPETTSVTATNPRSFIVETECRTEAGVAHGPYVSTHPDGERRAVGTYCNGYKDLTWTSWRRDGSKLSEGRYQRGAREGRWLFWDEPLHHEVYQDYRDGHLIGKGLATDGATLLAGYDTACQSGDQQACLHTAYMLGGRYGLLADDARALELYRGACDSGLPVACAQLGVELMNGDDPDAHSEAVALFARACDANNAEG